MPSLSVVLPTYNEAEGIASAIEGVSQALAGVEHEILVVDDDSPDGTWRVAQADPRVRVLRRQGERGLATAVIAGFREARGEFVAVMDADGQHPASLLPRLLESARAQKAVIAVASRHAPGGSDEVFVGARRRISRGAIMAAQAALPSVRERKVTDPVSGFFLVRRDALPPLDTLHPRGYKILLELLTRMPGPVVEVPFRFQARAAGVSKLSKRVVADYVLHLARLSTIDRKNRRFASFLLVGLSGVLVNLLPLLAAERVLGVSGFGPLLAASLVAREIAVLWNFALNDLITFRDLHEGRSLPHRLWRWHLATALSAGAYFAAFALLTFAGVSTLVAGLVAIGLGVLVNWAVASRWSYRRAEPKSPTAPEAQSESSAL